MLIIGFPIFSPRPQTKSVGTVVDITKDVFFRGAHFERLPQIQQDCAILIETTGSVFWKKYKKAMGCKTSPTKSQKNDCYYLFLKCLLNNRKKFNIGT